MFQWNSFQIFRPLHFPAIFEMLLLPYFLVF
jgi:hypothetical protein